MGIENPLNQLNPPSESDGAGEGRVNSTRSPEREHVSYDQAFAAAKLLRSKNVADPLDLEPEDAEVQAALDVIEDWKVSAGLSRRGVDTPEKARDVVRMAMMWLDAGYDEPAIVQAALEDLTNEHADAAREGNDEITAILADAIARLEERFVPEQEKDQRLAELKAKFEAGQQCVAEGKFAVAMGIFSGMLTDPFFKKNKALTAELQGKIEESFLAARADYEREQEPKRIAVTERKNALDALRKHGASSVESRSALETWRRGVEARFTASHPGESPAAIQIRADMEQSALMSEVGLYELAFSLLDGVQTQARQEAQKGQRGFFKDLFDKAGDMIDALPIKKK